MIIQFLSPFDLIPKKEKIALLCSLIYFFSFFNLIFNHLLNKFVCMQYIYIYIRVTNGSGRINLDRVSLRSSYIALQLEFDLDLKRVKLIQPAPWWVGSDGSALSHLFLMV